MNYQLYRYPTISTPQIHYQQHSINQQNSYTQIMPNQLYSPLTQASLNHNSNNKNYALQINPNEINLKPQQQQQYQQTISQNQQFTSISYLNISDNQLKQQQQQQSLTKKKSVKIKENKENKPPNFLQANILKSASKHNQQSANKKASILNVSNYTKKSQSSDIIKDLTEKIYILSGEIHKLASTIDQLVEINDKLKNKYRRVKELYINKISEKETQKHVTDKSELSLNQMKQVMNSYQQEIQEIKTKYEDFKTEETNKHSEEQQKLIETVEIYQEDAMHWKNQYEILSKEFAKQNKYIEEQQKEIKRANECPINDNQNKLQQQYKEQQKTIKAYESQINQLTEENETLYNEITEKDELIAEGSKAYEAKINELEQQIEEMQQQDNEELMEQNELLVDKYNQISENYSQLQQESYNLQETKQQLEMQIIQLNQQLENSKVSKGNAFSLIASPQSKQKQVNNDESDDYLVRQLRKFQELQSKTGNESIVTKKSGKQNKRTSFGSQKQGKK